MKRMTSIAAIAVALCAASASARGLCAQEQDAQAAEEAAAIHAVVEAVRAQLTTDGSLEPGGVIAITPQRIGVQEGPGQRPRILPGRRIEPGLLAGIASSTSASVAELDSVRACTTRNPATCGLNGADAVISFGELARTDAGPATLVVRIVHRVPRDTRQPVHSMMKRMELTKEGSRWVVSSQTVITIS